MSRAARQRGVAAVEMALLLPLLLLLLAGALFFARVIYHYQVMQRAAQDAALFLATVPASEMKSSTLSAGNVSLASAIVAAELADLRLDPQQYTVTLQCDGAACGLGAPSVVRAQVRALLYDDVLGYYTGDWGGYSGFALASSATMRYVGR